MVSKLIRDLTSLSTSLPAGYVRSNSYGAAELSQGSSFFSTSVEVNLNFTSTNEKAIDSESEFVDLSEYEGQLSAEEKGRPLLDRVYLTKCVCHLKDWKHTARVGFGFVSEVDHIQQDYESKGGFRECASQAYLDWRKRKPTCTVWEMIQILHEAREFNAISHLIEHVKEK